MTWAWTRWCPIPIRFGVYDKLPPLLANSLGAYETTLDAHGHRLFGIRQWRQEDQRLADRPHPGPQRQDHLAPRRAQLRRLQRRRLARPGGAAAGRHARADHRSAHRLSDRLACWKAWSSAAPALRSRAVGKPLAGKTGTSYGCQGHLVHRLLARPGGGRLMSASTIRAPWAAERAGRHRGGADLPRFHEGARWPMRRRRRSASRRASRKCRSTGRAARPVPPGTPGAIMEAFKAGTAPGEANAAVARRTATMRQITGTRQRLPARARAAAVLTRAAA